MATRQNVRVGRGAGASGGRLEPALELAATGGIDYLVFECLAERTIARENLARSRAPELGYAPKSLSPVMLEIDFPGANARGGMEDG